MLEKFTAEVIDKGAHACLPSRLNNEWLEFLSAELEAYFQKYPAIYPTDEAKEGAICCSLGAILIITSYKLKHPMLTVSAGQLNELLMKYRVELVLESLHRFRGFTYEPATLQTIFTNRQVTIGRG